MASVDPTLDVSDGSAFDTVVLQYIRDNFGVGELDMDLADMMVRRIAQLDPGINTQEGSAVNEFLIKVLPAIMQVPRLELQRIKRNQDLNNLDSMTDAEADRRLGNFFVSRRTGDVAVGTVRAYFANPVPVRTNLTNRATTASGLAFIPDGATSVSQSQMAANRQDGLFYVDISYVAEGTGDQYNIQKNEINNIENLPGLVRATNLSKFAGGVPRETSAALRDRAEKSLSERSLNSRNSIITIVTTKFPNQVLGVFPVGFGDSEMNRDGFLVEPSVGMPGVLLLVSAQVGAGGLGPYQLAFDDIDASTLRVYVGTTLLSPALPTPDYTLNHSVTVGVGDTVTLTNTPANPVDTVVIQHFRISELAPLVTEIPGSIESPPLFPAAEQSQTVHVGGKVDVFLKPSTEELESLTVENLQRFTVFKASDGIVQQDPVNSLWYFYCDRGLSCAEIGAVRGDIVELVTANVYGDPVVAPDESFVIERAEIQNRRFLLRSGPLDSIARINVDVRIRMAEDRALPLSRLVAVDNLGAPIFLDGSATSAGRAQEYTPDVFVPVAPSAGFLRRDSSLVQFPSTFQAALPLTITKLSSLLGYKTGTSLRFIDGFDTGGSNILYAVAEENIASHNVSLPLTRITDVNLIDALTRSPLESQYLRNIYPADIRSLDVSGGIDGDGTNPGRDSAGKVRVYFEKPTTLVMYGPAYGQNSTKFIHRKTKDVAGQEVVLNLRFSLLTRASAGGPAVLVLPEDYVEENGLWYFDVFVLGDSSGSTRSDGGTVLQSDLNLGDGAEMFVGDFGIDDEVYHRIAELECESAGSPAARSIGNTPPGPELPVDAGHPYPTFVGAWSGVDVFTITSGSNTPELVNNGVASGFRVLIFSLSTLAFRPGVVSNIGATAAGGDNRVVAVDVDFYAEGVRIGDVVAGTSLVNPEVIGFDTTVSDNDTLLLNGNPAAGALTIDVYKWDVVSQHEILDVVDASTLRLSNPGTGSGKRFSILEQFGNFRLRSPHVRLSAASLVEGTPGNDANQGFRAEGFWLDVRDPYDRTIQSPNYTFSTREYVLFRYTQGADTRYLPNARPVGSEIQLRGPDAEIQGSGRENFSFFCGARVSGVGTDFQFAVGPATLWTTTIDGTTATIDLEIGVDDTALRVFIPLATGGYRELIRVFSGSPAVGEYTFSSRTGLLFEDQITIHATDQALALAYGGGSASYFSWVRSVALLLESPPGYLGGDLIETGVGNIIVFLAAEHTAADLAAAINNYSSGNYAVVGAQDAGGDVVASPVVVNHVGGVAATLANGTGTSAGIGILTDAAEDFSVVLAGDVLYIQSATSRGIYTVAGFDVGAVTRLYVTPAFPTTGGPATVEYRVIRPYSNPTAAQNGVGENFVSRELRGRGIQIGYEWSSSVRDVHDFMSSTLSRSINQDVIGRHAVPVFANVELTVNSTVAVASDVFNSVRDFVVLLNQRPLYTSDLVRNPDIAEHIPIPVAINGLVHLENRRFRTYRSADGIVPRRIEAILPGTITVTVNT